MLKSAKDTSGLSVEPRNRSVLVSWTPDPTASRYNAVKPQSSGAEQLSLPNSGVRSPFEVERLPIESSCATTNARNVISRGDYAYVLNAAAIDAQTSSITYNDGLDVVDISNLKRPRVVGHLTWTHANPVDIALSADGRYAYIASAAIIQSYAPKSQGSIVAFYLGDPSGWSAACSSIAKNGTFSGATGALNNLVGRGRYLYANTAANCFEVLDLLE